MFFCWSIYIFCSSLTFQWKLVLRSYSLLLFLLYPCHFLINFFVDWTNQVNVNWETSSLMILFTLLSSLTFKVLYIYDGWHKMEGTCISMRYTEYKMISWNISSPPPPCQCMSWLSISLAKIEDRSDGIFDIVTDVQLAWHWPADKTYITNTVRSDTSTNPEADTKVVRIVALVENAGLRNTVGSLHFCHCNPQRLVFL